MMPKYLVMLVCSTTKRGGTPRHLPYRLEAENAIEAVDRAKKLASDYYPQYKTIKMDSVTEVRGE